MRRSVIRLYIIILILFCNSITKDVNAADLKQLYDFSLKIQKSFEGYHSKISGEDISYPSLRNDISDAILTRCTTGNSFIEWNTAPVPDNYKEHSVSFSWIASFDNTNKNRPFDVYINDVKRFTFEYTGNPNWSVNLSNNATLSFFKVKGDQHNDAQGYTLLSIPTSWIKPGLPVKIKICGQALGSNAWYMVFKCTNTVSYLQESMKYQGWFNLTSEKETNELSLSIHAPYYFSNKVLNLESGTIKKDIAFKLQGEDAIGMTTLPTSSIDQPFALNDKNNRLFNLKSLSGTYNESTLQEKSVVIRQCIEKGTSFNALINIVYQPGLSNSLLELSRGKFSEGSIMLMNSSHQDIAWMDSPEKCIIERDTMLLAPLFDQAKLNPNYRFDVEDVLMVKEFISRHPERKAEFQDLLLSGKLSCGSSYQMPYEEMYSDEALVRQFYLGAKWLKKEFNGYQANTYWNVDVPGRSLQMPQILKKAGTDFMVISRQTPGIFNWFSPDGSFVTTYSMGHYSLEYPNLNKPFFEAADFIGHSILEWDKRINLKADSKPVAPLFSDWDMSPAKDYSALISGWNSISSFEKKDGTIVNLNLPKISLSTAPAFLKKYVDANAFLPSIKGERPAVWLYIHGPSHQKAIRASRDGDILMTVAEKFSTIDCLLKKSFSGYPETRLTKAWENKIFPDHGWGGKHGDITDALFEAKYTSALSEAKQLTEISLNNIASTILTNNKKGIPVIVFNSLSWERTDPVSITVNFDPSKAASLKLYNGEGKEIAVQMSKADYYTDGSLKSATVCFIAEEIPSLGYKTFYLKPSLNKIPELAADNNPVFENAFYQIELTNGGIKQIRDKKLNVDLLKTDRYLGAEVFTMRSIGNGAGEFSDIQKPDAEGFDKLSNHTSKWVMTDNGPVYKAWKLRCPIRNAIVEQKIIVYTLLPKIDFEVSLLNWEGILYREFRFALPLNTDNGKVAYEVPFGVVEVGKDEIHGSAGERYTTPCKDVHPRGIENWMSVSGNGFGVTLSSSVAVCDYLDPLNDNNKQSILQPILIASRKSCHSEGNEYLQTGDHSFNFSLTSHAEGWKNGFRFGREANEKLIAMVAPTPFKNAFLPETLSFFSVSNPNIMVSTIKKSEDDNDVVIRLFETEGADCNLSLSSFFKFNKAQRTNLIEENGLSLPMTGKSLTVPVGHNSIETFKLEQ